VLILKKKEKKNKYEKSLDSGEESLAVTAGGGVAEREEGDGVGPPECDRNLFSFRK
jgi:hypothetical protein